MNKRSITKVFNEAPLEEFTVLPIEPMELLQRKIREDPAGDKALSSALDLYLSLALTKPALKKIRFRKVYVRWEKDSEELFPAVRKIEVFRYSMKKYLLIAHVTG